MDLLKSLPAAPPGKTGWPWTAGSLPVPETMPDGAPWPRVSIVTPSYNQGQFLEETIRSVLLQGYPDLEYIVVDDCSSDGSWDIIKKYSGHLSAVLHERNQGQSAAINNGFRRSSGAIIAWLNSDDLLMPNAVYLAACYLADNTDVGMVTGDREIIDAESRRIGERQWQKFAPWQFKYCSGIAQEASFWRRNIFFKCGQLDETLHFGMDLDLWIRISRISKIHHLPVKLGVYRAHGTSNSMLVNRAGRATDIRIKKMAGEAALVRQRYYGRDTLWLEKLLLPRLQNLLGKLEVRFGDYAAKKRYCQAKLKLLQAAEKQ